MTPAQPRALSASAARYFADEWDLDEQGIPHRQAARVIAVNEAGQALLLRGHDFSDVEHWWWFTIGGGLHPGEDPLTGAIREFEEETGVRLSPADLVGPVLKRHATFDFHDVTCRQDELFYFTRLSGSPQFTDRGFTAVERQVLDQLKWWDLADLEQEISAGAVVYPLNFVSLVRSLIAGWNKQCPEITEGTVPKR